MVERSQKSLNRLILIGASAGGVEALPRVVATLPKGILACVVIVLHVGKTSMLPQLLSRSTPLPVRHAKDGDRIEKGRIYVAPPNFHMLVKPGHLHVIMGPKENYCRPAINPVFRTAATAYGKRAVGVILTGFLDDGAIGLKTIKHNGGITIVQDPEDASAPDMPLNAIRKDEVDHVLRLSELGPFLVNLSKTKPQGDGGLHHSSPERVEPDILELSMKGMRKKIMSGEQTELTCPECGGTLFESKEEGLVNFRCHVGHAFSGAAMEEASNSATEGALWNAVRILEERNAILRRVAGEAGENTAHARRDEAEREARRARDHAEVIRRLIIEGEHKDKREEKETPRRKGQA